MEQSGLIMIDIYICNGVIYLVYTHEGGRAQAEAHVCMIGAPKYVRKI